VQIGSQAPGFIPGRQNR